MCRWLEQDPEELLESVRQCLEEVGGRLGEEGVGRLRGVGITNQRETTIVWDNTTGEPLNNAIGNFRRFVINICWSCICCRRDLLGAALLTFL